MFFSIGFSTIPSFRSCGEGGLPKAVSVLNVLPDRAWRHSSFGILPMRDEKTGRENRARKRGRRRVWRVAEPRQPANNSSHCSTLHLLLSSWFNSSILPYKLASLRRLHSYPLLSASGHPGVHLCLKRSLTSFLVCQSF